MKAVAFASIFCGLAAAGELAWCTISPRGGGPADDAATQQCCRQVHPKDYSFGAKTYHHAFRGLCQGSAGPSGNRVNHNEFAKCCESKGLGSHGESSSPRQLYARGKEHVKRKEPEQTTTNFDYKPEWRRLDEEGKRLANLPKHASMRWPKETDRLGDKTDYEYKTRRERAWMERTKENMKKAEATLFNWVHYEDVWGPDQHDEEQDRADELFNWIPKHRRLEQEAKVKPYLPARPETKPEWYRTDYHYVTWNERLARERQERAQQGKERPSEQKETNFDYVPKKYRTKPQA
ncbi:hypothetical protein BT63DRAFT_437021 [Microthyrium microscopicum]|uniref:Uncharacterized protein n=1 Tax=Microthyrium microscopicum TaxID=703497 RepID=A0A6A6UM09_9PEZI|nr:hypothetical protein BT63DRAFT_437021 [Microthyrium microscopicum]